MSDFNGSDDHCLTPNPTKLNGTLRYRVRQNLILYDWREEPKAQEANCLPCINLTEGKRPGTQKSFETKDTLVTDISFHFCTPNSSHPRTWTLRAPSSALTEAELSAMHTAHSSCRLSPVITREQESQLPCKVIPVVNRPSV